MLTSNEPNDCFLDMALAECREKSFIEWPFKDGKCTAKEMAKAGFYAANQFAVTCYFCFKELEGWENDDDPYAEHKKHAPYCGFVNMFDKAPDSITFSQLLKLEKARKKRLWELLIEEIYESTQEIIQKSLKSSIKRRHYKKRK